MQGLVDAVSALLEAPATLEDRDFRLIAFAAHEGELDPVRAGSILRRGSSAEVRAWFESFGIARAAGPVRTPADPASGILERLCLPARHRGVTYAYLWLLDGGAIPPGDPRLAEAMELAAEAAARLAVRPSRALAGLLSDEPAEREEAERLLAGHPVADGRYVVIVASGSPPQGVIAHRDVILTVTPDLAGRLEGPVGISASWRGLAHVREAVEQARTARRVAARVPGFARITHWDELGPYRLLTDAVDPRVVPLLGNEVLRGTAETYLDEAGHAQRTAEALTIHRQTLYYRLHRIEQLTGLDLDSGPDRLALHMSLKSAHLRD
ncbi:helix-turn-helix domain-containing protein [Actinocorallia longicatena]|uniref:Helix-turn-helix domain-containing protein n=1 Tax=Actinocorallia longicatena TaxID=111803 RepID=A0ABP6QIP3_9ACTN